MVMQWYVVIRGYVPQGAGFYTRYYVYVIQWQRALVVYMSLGQLDSWLRYLSDVSTPSDAAGRSRRPEKRYMYMKYNAIDIDWYLQIHTYKLVMKVYKYSFKRTTHHIWFQSHKFL